MEEQKNTKRLIAYKVKIKDLLEGKYVKEDGWQPNHIIINRGNVSRVNIIGTVISESRDETAHMLMIDDGSGKIILQDFERRLLKNISIGRPVNVVGRIREFGKYRYIIPESIKETDPKWCEVRKKGLQVVDKKSRKQAMARVDEELVGYSEEIATEMDCGQKIMELIKSRDFGPGVDIDEVAVLIKSGDAEKIVRKLIENGELFEVRPGKVKVLE